MEAVLFLLESILIAAVSLTASTENNGYLGGVVVLASDGQPVAGAEVVLSIRQGDQFIPAAKTVADEDGKFFFGELPVAPHVIYKPGANWGGIHYPGPATRLTPSRPVVGLKLTVNQAVSEPNLLVARRHEMTIRAKPGSLEVSEVLVIDNPTVDCYVGKPLEEGGEPETLCLNIPSGFEQVTFDEEFYGRGFSLSDGRLVTSIPWTPGQRELRFTYVLRNEQRQLNWTRPLDLPCSDVTVRIIADEPEDVTCSLEAERTEETGAIVYQYSGPEIEAGREIHIELGRLSVPPLAYGKWAAAALLAVLVVLATVWKRRQRGTDGPSSPATTSETHTVGSASEAPQSTHHSSPGPRSVSRRNRLKSS